MSEEDLPRALHGVPRAAHGVESEQPDAPVLVAIGHGVEIRYTTWANHPRAGLLIEHEVPGEDRRCESGLLFDLPGVADAFPERALWRVVSFEPLHLEPSIRCAVCSLHGWIHGGAWVPA